MSLTGGMLFACKHAIYITVILLLRNHSAEFLFNTVNSCTFE